MDKNNPNDIRSIQRSKNHRYRIQRKIRRNKNNGSHQKDTDTELQRERLTYVLEELTHTFSFPFSCETSNK